MMVVVGGGVYLIKYKYYSTTNRLTIRYTIIYKLIVESCIY